MVAFSCLFTVTYICNVLYIYCLYTRGKQLIHVCTFLQHTNYPYTYNNGLSTNTTDSLYITYVFLKFCLLLSLYIHKIIVCYL